MPAVPLGWGLQRLTSPVTHVLGRIASAVRYDLTWRFAKPGRFRRHIAQAVTNVSHGVCMFDAKDRLQLVNDQFCKIYEQPMSTLHLGMSFLQLLEASIAVGNYPGRSAEDVWKQRKEFIDKRQFGNFFQELGDGRVISILHQPLVDGGWLAVYEDITEHRRAEAEIRFLAQHDSLTNLANQATLCERIELLAAEKQAATLVLVDLDGFKNVNDDLGHAAGNIVLREVARRLLACVRATDMVARLGGDEFALILVGLAEPQLAVDVVTTLIQALSQVFNIEGHTICVGASIGYAHYNGDGSSTADLLSNADLALYQAKGEGRQCARPFTVDLRVIADRARAYDNDLRRAYEKGEFVVFYQPQVRLSDGALIGAEALLRWRHPVDGLLSPATFLPALEVRPISAAVGGWTMRAACRQAAIWSESVPGFRMGINLFGSQFHRGTLVSDVMEALSNSGLPASALELEVTENIVLRHNDTMLTLLQVLRAKGIGISFDDYGTGYASLSMLKRFPLTRLKIDQSFVAGMCTSPADAAVVRAILDLGHAFGFSVIAEGVETLDQANWLKREGCTEAQGYLYGRPVAADDFAATFGLTKALLTTG